MYVWEVSSPHFSIRRKYGSYHIPIWIWTETKGIVLRKNERISNILQNLLDICRGELSMIPVIQLSGAHNGSRLQITSLDWIDIPYNQQHWPINQTPTKRFTFWPKKRYYFVSYSVIVLKSKKHIKTRRPL